MVKANQGAVEMAHTAALAASDKLASDIVILDVSSHLPLADLFVICSVSNARQMGAVLDAVEDRLRAAGHKPTAREGKAKDDWVLLSYPEIVVHVQTQEARDFYRLTRLWSDCPELPVPVVAGDRR